MKKTVTILVAMLVLMAVGTVRAAYDVEYDIELKNDDSCIKFDNAEFWDEAEGEWVDAGLGEEGVLETDVFEIEADDVVEVTVYVKAGKDKADAVLTEGMEVVLLGFRILMEGDTFTVTSTENTKALSYIMFCFGEGATVTAPTEETYEVERVSPNDAPGVEPEEIDED